MINIHRAKMIWVAFCASTTLTLPIGNSHADHGTLSLTVGDRAKIETSRSIGADDKFLVVAQNEGRMPPLLGKTKEEATERLRQSGFTGNITALTSSVDEPCPENYNRFVKGLVCDTDPRPRDTAPLNADVVLLVQGDRPVDDQFGVPPNVVGMTLGDALNALHEHRFSVGAGQNPMHVRFSTHPNCKSKVSAGDVCALIAEEGHWAPGNSDWQPTARMGSTPVVPSRDRSSFTVVLTSAREKDGSDKEQTASIEMIPLVGLTVEEALRRFDLAGFRDTISRKQRQACEGGTWKTWESTPTPQEILGSEICWQSAAPGTGVRADRPIYYQVKALQQ